nr:hypothetical protein [Rhizobium sp. RCAM05350]
MELVLDTWNFLIRRQAYFGVRRFDKFQQRLGIPYQPSLEDALARK